MKTILGFLLITVASAGYAAGNSDALLLAQAQTQTKTPVTRSTPPKVPQPTSGCLMDSHVVGDGRTWCQKGTVFQCNASAGTWVSTGRKCP